MVESILLEAKYYKNLLKNPSFKTIYFGGGTPSLLPSRDFLELSRGLREIFDFSQVKEWTLEANPNTFHQEKAFLFKEMGISRISLGIQATQDKLLQDLGRDYSYQEAIKSYDLLRKTGISNINLDVMFGIHGQNFQQWKETLKEIVNLKPEHLSCYNLNYEKGTPFFTQLQKGELIQDEEKNRKFFLFAHQFLEKKGYSHYEISNYAKSGKESKHNQAYWQGKDYLGLGPSAVSTIKGKRHKNIASTENYISQIKKGTPAFIFETEKLTSAQRKLEKICLLLRTKKGIPLTDLKNKEKQIQMLVKNELGKSDKGYFSLSSQGFLIADEISQVLSEN